MILPGNRINFFRRRRRISASYPTDGIWGFLGVFSCSRYLPISKNLKIMWFRSDFFLHKFLATGGIFLKIGWPMWPCVCVGVGCWWFVEYPGRALTILIYNPTFIWRNQNLLPLSSPEKSSEPHLPVIGPGSKTKMIPF